MKALIKSGCAAVFAIAAGIAAAPQVSGQSIIVTAAGTDLVFGGAGQAATAAPLGRVSRVTVDASGRPVFSDPNYHLIFRVETNGSISVIAGNNIQGLANAPGYGLGHSGGGYSGDQGQAKAAALNRPEGVAYDAAGNLYIADTFNQRIRMVNPQGVITTFAGSGRAGFQDSAQAASAAFNFPDDVVADASGNLYVNDSQNYRIRKITPQGVVSTVAGTGTPGSAAENVSAASAPIAEIEGMAVDNQGYLYLADFTYSRVRKIAGGVISTVAGTGTAGSNDTGTALSASLNSPGGLAFDQNGNLLISDTGNLRVLKLSGGALSVIAGTGQSGFSGDGGSALNANLHNPFGLAVAPAGTIYVADRDNFRIRSIASGAIATAAGNGSLISSQNGVAPALATLLDPFGVSVDSTGSLLIADTDNNIVRRLGNNALATIAGTGAQESSGDNGPATQAGLFGPFSVNSDKSNNFFEAEANDGRIREIGSSGLISTIVSGLNVPTQAIPDANGNVWISDFENNRILRRAADGSITQVSGIPNPAGLALDGLGNVYVTEAGAARVQKISSTGAVTTIAGGGSIAGTGADGGPATNAQLGTPTGITVDSAGSVYFSDAANANVRKVALNGSISTVAGNGRSAFSGDGGPATSASLGEPWGLTLDSAGSLYIADVLNNRVRKVLLTSSPSFSVDQSSVSLTAASNGKVTSPATVNLTSTLTGLLFSVSTDQSWLSVTPASGAMPGSVQISADPTGLNSGSYSGHVTVTAAGASPASISVNVAFNVTPAAAPSLATDTNILSYSFLPGGSTVTSQVSVRNQGSGSLSYSASASLASGTGWLSVSPASGTATPNSPGFVTVTVTAGQLPAGTYTATLTITGGDGTTVNIPVSAVVAAPVTNLQLTQPGLTFPAIRGGGAPLPRTFSVLNTGSGSMSWTAAVTTSSPWLSISPASGTVVNPQTDASPVTVSVNPSGLAAGTYYGLVTVNAQGNSAQTVTIALNVLASGSGADVYPAALLFTSQAQGQNSSSQSFSIANLGTQPLSYTSSRLVTSGSPWFVQVPATGVISPGQAATIVVQPDFTNLQAGSSYQGSIALQFSDGSHATVNLSAAVIATSLSPQARGEDDKPAASGCTPKSITTMQLLNSQPMSVTLGQGVALSVNLLDNCGPVTSSNRAAASVGFSNKDAQVNLNPDPSQPGLWTGNWTPANSASGAISLSIVADEANVPINQLFPFPTATLAAAAGPTPPIVSAAFIQNAASFATGQPVSPGGLITIFGSNLGDGPASQSVPPLQTSLGNMQILVGGNPLPLLYVSSSQVNAQIPPNLPVNTMQPLLVQHNNVPSVSTQISVASASPAIFSQTNNGLGQGAITNAVTNALADASHPVASGVDYVSIYCTGLGIVSPSIPAGQPAPIETLSHTTSTVTATIGGKAATVTFAGLAPGYAGLYQVNALVPAGLTPGTQPVTISILNQTSPAVTIAVK